MKTALVVIAAMGTHPGFDFPWRDRGNDEPVVEVEYTVLHEEGLLENGTNTPKQYGVLTNQETYAEVFAKYTSAQPPEVDFSQSKVLLLDMGWRANSGYWFEIGAVRESEEAVTVELTIVDGNYYCFTQPAIFNPYQFVQIDTRKQVLFDESYELRDCELPSY